MKFAKSEVDYSRGMIDSHCGPTFIKDRGYCEHFIAQGKKPDGKCQLVEGEISPIMWCKKFEKAKEKKP